jgi:dTDP-4-dehydrorhamnose reductase
MGETIPMKKIVILGSTGMLGNTVAKYFLKSKDLKVFTSFRKNKFKWDNNSFYFDAIMSKFSDIPDCDYIINCIGIIKPHMTSSMENSIFINSLFPHQLAKYCNSKNIKLIHITTDCVFSGNSGTYDENSKHDCLDEYGKSKSLGETDNCMTIRTSIIGEEIHSKVSLVEWVKSMKSKTVNGFTNHIWNGMTTLQYAKICELIIKKELFENGIFHVYSNKVDKRTLVSKISEAYELNITVNPYTAPKAIDRSLTTVEKLNSQLNVPNIEEQIRDMKKFGDLFNA